MSLLFDLLHIEAVSYVKDMAKTGSTVPCDALEGLDKNSADLVQNAMAHVNPETRLEALGFRIGEMLAERISKDLPRLSSDLEVMKFICKEFWTNVFGKQVDNLRTNHHGVYVVQDNKFTCLAAFPEGAQYVKECLIYLALPCGMVRGALSALGVKAIVTPTTDAAPAAKFHVHIQSS